MKLATYQDGSRDGQLLVVSRDLSTAHYATGIAHRLQQVLEDWNFLAPQLQDLSDALNAGRARHAFPFDPSLCMAPLPRAYQWAQGGAYPHLDALLDASAAAGGREPVLQRGASDAFLGAGDAVVCSNEAVGLDFGAGLAVVTGDVRAGQTPAQALDGVRLLMLVNDFTLRQVADPLLAKPATAFGPVAVTPDELGPAWDHGRLHLTLQTSWNGRTVGLCDAAADMSFHFGQLIAQLSKTRALAAGTVVGTGVVSQKALAAAGGKSAASKGYHCIAEKRALEMAQDGAAQTPYLRVSDTVRIEMKGADGRSVFGAIEQDVVAPA